MGLEEKEMTASNNRQLERQNIINKEGIFPVA